ncbi:iron chelate uptake ABC transporter family permease subunit [Streptomyces massasporeus]|uniref:iron chelate uptake ABC transporter family permease subunit n=1 Tax=Streptomyces massasporeus TaxID=67324 RepID=UPI003F53F64E
MARRVDALALGDDTARGLGVPVRATRVTVVVLAALLSAAAVTLGAALVGTADLLGRTVIAPAQLGAGLMTAVIGTPYFLHLLVRSRRAT